MADRRRESPFELTESWPDVPSTDPAGEKARLFVLNLRGAIGERSVRSVAKDADLDEGTVRRVLAGAAWPDLHTIARIEQALGVSLYPGKGA